MSDEKPPEVVREEGDPAEAGAGNRSFIAEAVRKAVLAGVGALFLTEEGARRLAREWKLPKDLAGYVVGQAQGARDEVLRLISQEVRRFLESETFRRELGKFIGSMAIEVKAQIRFTEPAEAKRGAAKSRHRDTDEGDGPRS